MAAAGLGDLHELVLARERSRLLRAELVTARKRYAFRISVPPSPQPRS
jgi:hypothetical protein